jgi:hypothetical protein
VFYWLDNLAEEVDKIWNGEWRTGKVLFLLTTYSVLARGFVDLPSEYANSLSNITTQHSGVIIFAGQMTFFLMSSKVSNFAP